MSMVVKNNMSAISTLNTLNKNSSALSKSLEKVSSGMKINGAADDASGYAISERMRVQIRGLDQANSNTQNGNAMMKVAEGAVSSTVDILKTLKEKVINAANDTNTDSDRQTIQKELDQSIDQIDDNANITYNGKYLVDGTHNNKTGDVSTRLTNESLFHKTTSGSKLVDLKSRTEDGLNIHATDNVTVSFVRQGRTYTTTFTVGSNTTLANIMEKTAYNGTDDKFEIKKVLNFSQTTATSKIGKDGSGNTIYTADRGCALTLVAQTAGVSSQVSGFTISITNNKGQINKSANAVLDNFTESIRAQNKSDDNAMVFQVGTKANQAIKVGLTDMRSTALGLKGDDGQTLNVSTQVKA
ncbi:MAG: flagellin, partial [Bacteroidaceae bacterium]|nr:flagellin [Bacteroidaceae bacterium]